MSDYKELLAQREEINRKAMEIDRQIKEAQRAERALAIGQILGLMKIHNLTAADLEIRGGRQKSSGTPHASAGTKVAPKYRNSETGETWTGRGIKPKWLQAAIANGATLESFAI